MPTISLRLTDEQHAELKAWAHGAQRSVQREIVYRLFTVLPWTEAAREQLNIERIAAGGGEGGERAQKILDQRRSDADPHFKPDFKGGK